MFRCCTLFVCAFAFLSCNTPTPNAAKKIRKPKAEFLGQPEFAFSPDGKWIAYLRGMRDTATWKSETKSPNVQDYWDSAIAFSPDSKLLAVGSREGTVVVYSVPLYQPLFSFRSDINAIIGLGFTSDSKSIVTASFDGSVSKYSVEVNDESTNTAKQWPPLFQQAKKRRDLKYGREKFALSPDRSRIAVGDGERIQVLNIDDFSNIKSLPGGSIAGGSLMDLRFSPDGKHVLSIAADVVTSFSIDDDSPPKTFQTTNIFYNTSGSWCQNGEVVAVFYFGQNSNMVIEFFDFMSAKSMGAFPVHAHPVAAGRSKILLSPDESILASSGGNSGLGDLHVRLWEYSDVLKNLVAAPPPNHEELKK
jgi:WD40 repeat protein